MGVLLWARLVHIALVAARIKVIPKPVPFVDNEVLCMDDFQPRPYLIPDYGMSMWHVAWRARVRYISISICL